MDFLSFENGMKVKPYCRKVTTIQSQSHIKAKPKEYYDNPLLSFSSRNTKIDKESNNDIKELIHNAQLAKRFNILLTLNEFFPKRNTTMRRSTLTVLTPYQRYDKERQFTLENMRSKKNFQLYKPKDYVTIPRSPIKVRTKLSHKSATKISSSKTIMKDYDAFTLTNIIMKEYNNKGKKCVMRNKII